jgi:hypothetical protein
MNMKSLLTFIILITYFQLSFGQVTFDEQKDSLITLRNLVLKARNDIERTKHNEAFINVFKTVLNDKNTMTFPFDNIPSLGVISSSDQAVRLINWNVPKNDGTYLYYCFVQYYDKKTKNYHYQFLIDQRNAIIQPERKQLDTQKWYGALYYQIIPIQNKKEKYYVLLGWVGHDNFSTKKVIEAMTISPKGEIKFGLPIFENEENKTYKRLIFEYSAQATMSLKYDEKQNIIIFDHLSPLNDDLKGVRQYYVPDMSYDGLKLDKGKWIYIKDVDAKISDDKKPYNDPRFKK